jgi:amidase
VIVAASIAYNLEARAAALGRTLAERDVERMTWDRVLDARTMTAAQYAGSIGVVHRVGRIVARFFQSYDVILSPTMCAPPQPLGVLDMSTEHPDRYLSAVFASIGFTSLFNSSGHPAMTVPLATSSTGLPLGVQFAGRFGDEATLLRLAGQLEAARPWSGRRPSISNAVGAEVHR